MAEKINRNQLNELGSLEFLAKQAVEGFITGLHKSPFHGFSVEFAEHRLYNEGESTRHIDWKLYGRTDKLFIKRYEEETNLRCRIVIDTSSSMFFPFSVKGKAISDNKMNFSVHCAAAIMQLMRKQRDAVGLSFFNEKLSLHTQAKSNPLHHKYLYKKLEEQLEESTTEKEAKETFAVESLHEIAEAIGRRALVVLFSDMMDSNESTDELFHALNHVRHNKHEVILFHVVDKSKELDFDFENRPYEFIDVETGERMKLNAAEVKENYISQQSKFVKELKLKCSQYRIDFVEADINEGVRQVLTSYLVKRMKMR